jgi:hypothetical protein
MQTLTGGVEAQLETIKPTKVIVIDKASLEPGPSKG